VQKSGATIIYARLASTITRATSAKKVAATASHGYAPSSAPAATSKTFATVSATVCIQSIPAILSGITACAASSARKYAPGSRASTTITTFCTCYKR
jgi:hypothetical protein